MIRRDKFVFLLVVMHSYFPESKRTVKLFEGFGSRFKKKKIFFLDVRKFICPS